MAIVQISKIQQRAGNLVDLPQLDNGEFGWATDENRLFIGRTGNNYSDQNIEVLTSYSNISFDQINGSDGGNFNITTALSGQILTYVSSTNTWENYTGNSNQIDDGKLQLGPVSNLTMSGGAAGYVLQTDGIGNLSWAPKGTLYTNIISLSNATPIVMTVANTTPYTNGQAITISGVNGAANANVNGLTFYLTLATDYASSGNVKLYTDSGRTANSNGTSLTYTNSPNAIATATIGTGGGGGSATVGGANTAVQFNDQNVLNGDSLFTFNKTTTTLTVSSGTISTGNITASTTVTSPRLISNVANGTAPLTVSSVTRVANLNVAYANVTDYTVTSLQTTGTWYPIFANATSGNVGQGANANLSFNAATGNLIATLLTGTLTTAAQNNITSLGTLGNLTVTSNITTGNLIGIYANGNSNVSIPAVAGNVNISSNGVANILVVTSTGANITGTANVSGNANTGNLGTTTLVATTGNITTINSGLMKNASSNITITTDANITLTANTNSTLVVTSTGANITGYANVSGNANVLNIGTSQVLASANVTSPQFISNIATATGAPFSVQSTNRVANLNVSYANVSDYVAVSAITSGTYYIPFVSGTAAANYTPGANTTYSANIANGSLAATLFIGNLSGTNITTGANSTEGNITGNWTLTAGSRLQATYADLAEYYEADKLYEAGTVLEFGGEKEVTLAESLTPRVAGVVSTNPAYVMNSTCEGEHIVALALQGRVPCKVRGTIRKGDMLVSAGGGFARPSTIPLMGTVIGKSLENFEGEGIIEVAVGRL